MTTKPPRNEAVAKAASAVGNPATLGRLIGVKPQTVNDWLHGGKPVPVKRCVLIEQVTNGAVTRKDLRPTDWQDNWPELATQAQAVPA